MKWEGQEHRNKHSFLEWVSKANEKELKDYIIDRNYPTTEQGKKRKRTKNTLEAIFIIFFFVGLYGTAIFGGLYFEELEYHKEYRENLETAGDYICYEHGGFLKVYYKNEEVFVTCADKSIRIDNYGTESRSRDK